MANTANLTDKKDGFLFATTLQALLSELSSPTNLILTAVCLYLVYKIFFGNSETSM